MVTEVHESHVRVRLLEDGKEHDVYPDKWQSFQYAFDKNAERVNSREVGSYTQIPLIHGWAITIHKSQGSEFPAVIIPVTSQHFIMLQRNLLYTGVTRARKLIILVGQQSALQRCVFNDRQSQRFTQLSSRLRKLLGK